jgi:hypothetical protein
MPGNRRGTAVAALLAVGVLLCVAAPANAQPPKPVPAWYMTAANAADLTRQAKNSACAFADDQPDASRLMLFDFGGAIKYVNGGFGANLRGVHPFRNGAILQAMTGASRAYKRCHRRGSATIAYGNSNSIPGHISYLDAYDAGLHQALTVKSLRRFQQKHHYGNQDAAAAGDIEPGFGLPGVSKALVDGANEVTYYDFGNAGGCPGQPGASGCYQGWTVDDLGEVSMGGHSRPLPEIYRPYEATQWARIQDRWDGGRYVFAGVTGAPNEPLSPAQGWSKLNERASAVQRELISIRDGEGAARGRRAAPSGRDRAARARAGGPMSATTPAHLVAKPQGFFSTSLIYPLANEWVAASRQRFVAVDAGTDPLNPSTGVLGIFRQNYVRVRQTERVIEVPGAGRLELSGAPAGAAKAALAGPRSLRFEGANGISGVLDLSDATVTLDTRGGGSP